MTEEKTKPSLAMGSLRFLLVLSPAHYMVLRVIMAKCRNYGYPRYNSIKSQTISFITVNVIVDIPVWEN